VALVGVVALYCVFRSLVEKTPVHLGCCKWEKSCPIAKLRPGLNNWKGPLECIILPCYTAAILDMTYILWA